MSNSSNLKRFYTEVSIECQNDVYCVLLDGRQAKTPNGEVLSARYRPLADAMVVEWDSQSVFIDFSSMIITRLCMAVIEQMPTQRTVMIEQIKAFAETELVCYQVEHPQDLVSRQQALWQPVLVWAEETLGIVLPVNKRIVGDMPSADTIYQIGQRAKSLDDYHLMGLMVAIDLLGSCLIGFALLKGHFNADTAFKAAFLEELWQHEKWGSDEEAKTRLEDIRRDTQKLANYFRLLKLSTS